MLISDKEKFHSAIAKFLGTLNPEDLVLMKTVNVRLMQLYSNLRQRSERNIYPQLSHIGTSHKKSSRPTFDYKQLPCYDQLLHKYFYPDIRLIELLSIANILVGKCPSLSLSRDEKRSKALLFRWFDKHWKDVEPVICHMIVENKDGIQLNRKANEENID